MEALISKGYRRADGHYEKDIGLYLVRLFPTKKGDLVRQILKKGEQLTIGKFKSVFKAESDPFYIKIINEYESIQRIEKMEGPFYVTPFENRRFHEVQIAASDAPEVELPSEEVNIEVV